MSAGGRVLPLSLREIYCLNKNCSRRTNHHERGPRTLSAVIVQSKHLIKHCNELGTTFNALFLHIFHIKHKHLKWCSTAIFIFHRQPSLGRVVRRSVSLPHVVVSTPGITFHMFNDVVNILIRFFIKYSFTLKVNWNVKWRYLQAIFLSRIIWFIRDITKLKASGLKSLRWILLYFHIMLVF